MKYPCLVREFIHDRLYNSSKGYFMKETHQLGQISSPLRYHDISGLNSYLEVLVFSCGIYLFSFTGYSAAYTLVSESYPTEIRSLGVGWTHAWCKFGGLVSPLTVGVLLQNEGGLYISILIVGFCFSVVGVLALLTTETRNRSIA